MVAEEKSAKRFSESDWLYSSARTRALEKNLPDASFISRLLEARDESEVCSLCSEKGISISMPDYEKGLSEYLLKVYSENEEMIPDKGFSEILRMPYDVHNLKCAIKCSVLSRDPMRIMSPLGHLPLEEVKKSVDEKVFDIFYDNTKKAAAEAIDLYSRTKDPQVIDYKLDYALALDRYNLAVLLNSDFFIEWISMNSDITNILTTIRLMRMTGESTDTSYLERMLLPSGSLSFDFFTDVYDDGELALWAKLSTTKYSSLEDMANSANELSLSFVEKCCEDFKLNYLKKSKMTLAGPSIPCAYVVAAEYFVKDIRIVLAGKRSGLDTDTIKERLRDTYV